MDFSDALKLLKDEKFIRRPEAPNNVYYIEEEEVTRKFKHRGKDKIKKVTKFMMLNTVSDDTYLWQPSQVDMMADDWEEVELEEG